MQNIFCTLGYIEGRLRINTDDTLQLEDRDANGTSEQKTTTSKLRDASSWYHIMLVLDALGTEGIDKNLY